LIDISFILILHLIDTSSVLLDTCVFRKRRIVFAVVYFYLFFKIFWILNFLVYNFKLRDICLIFELDIFILLILKRFYWAVRFWKLSRSFSCSLNFIGKFLISIFFLSLLFNLYLRLACIFILRYHYIVILKLWLLIYLLSNWSDNWIIFLNILNLYRLQDFIISILNKLWLRLNFLACQSIKAVHLNQFVRLKKFVIHYLEFLSQTQWFLLKRLCIFDIILFQKICLSFLHFIYRLWLILVLL